MLEKSIQKEGNFLTKKFEKKYLSVLKDQEIQKECEEKIADWQSQVKYQILKENPYLDLEESLLESEKLHEKREEPQIKHLENYLEQIKILSEKSGESFPFKFCQKEINKLHEKQQEIFKLENNKEDNKTKKSKRKQKIKILLKKKQEWQEEFSVLEKLILQEWRKSFDQICSDWELQKLKELRETFFQEVENWLKLLTELKKTCDSLSVETGFLWDLSKGQLRNTNIDLLKKWVKYIKNNDGLKKLCDLMGRIKRHEKSKRQEVIQTTTRIQHMVTDENSKEEIVGLTFGRDLENVLPSELALLSDADTTSLFDIKFIENRLMCFQKEGLRPVDKEIRRAKKITVEEEKPGGPIIICVDTSGSMQGAPENIAKALTLILTCQASSQKRDCLLINFSTNIETFTMTKDMGVEKLFDFLKKSFHGGTDVSPAFAHSLEMMQKEKFEKADLLVISDFVIPHLEEDIVEGIKKMKKKKNRFFSLSIGDFFLDRNLRDTFDQEWIYNPSSMNIEVIKKIKDNLT